MSKLRKIKFVMIELNKCESNQSAEIKLKTKKYSEKTILPQNERNQ